MDKLKMQTPDLTDKNIELIAQLFPNVITETKDENDVAKKAVDFDLLKQILSKNFVEGDNERYRLDWPGKKASLLKANTPITKTLRPCNKESVCFNTTENLYIEGDNFEVLKVLQESYLERIHMIYIDPPYNTGTSMIYNNDFSIGEISYMEELGAISEDGVKMFRNTDSDGRIHSNWLSFMYERLLIARDLLKEEGILALTIDDYELPRIEMILDEVFGEENHLGTVAVRINPKGRMTNRKISLIHEYIIFYAKSSKSHIKKLSVDPSEKSHNYIKDNDESWYLPVNLRKQGVDSAAINKNGKMSDRYYPIYYDRKSNEISTSKEFSEKIYPIDMNDEKRIWRRSKDAIEEMHKVGDLIVKDTKNGLQIYFKFRGGLEGEQPKSIWMDSKFSASEYGTKEVDSLLGKRELFSYPKAPKAVEEAIRVSCDEKDSIILDFFSGSATTAQAVMQLNAEDGASRKFIMVQLPEQTDENSEAYKAGYKTIAEIGKERIRRAGKKIVEELKAKNQQLELGQEPVDPNKLDIGFRVYKIDDSNMKDVFYHPSELKQDQLSFLISNIKDDRTPEDLLTQVILDLGLELSLPVESKKMLKNEVFIVQGNALVACFDNDIDFRIVDTIADLKPFKVVFKDASFKDDKDRINVEERFKRLSPETKVMVI